jgi:hypothetical protein
MFSIFCLFCFLSCRFICCSGDEDENTPIDATARTSTSRTLVVSEAQPDGDETSPPQQDTEHPTPAASPRASSPKRAKVEPTKEPLLLAGSSTTPSLDDVSFSLFFFRTFQDLSTPLCFLLSSCRTFPSYIDFSCSFGFLFSLW